MESIVQKYHDDKFSLILNQPSYDIENGFKTMIESGRTDLAIKIFEQREQEIIQNPQMLQSISKISDEHHNKQFLSFLVEGKLKLSENQQFKQQHPLEYDNIMEKYIMNVVFEDQGKQVALNQTSKLIDKNLQEKLSRDINQKCISKQNKIQKVRKLSVSTGQQDYVSKGHTREDYYKHELKKRKQNKQRKIALFMFIVLFLISIGQLQTYMFPLMWKKLNNVIKSILGLK